MANVTVTFMCYLCGWWKATVVGVITTCAEEVVDVIAIVADEIATWGEFFNYGRCFCLCGRWIGHMGSTSLF